MALTNETEKLDDDRMYNNNFITSQVMPFIDNLQGTMWTQCMQILMHLKELHINVSVLRLWGYRKAVV